MNCRQFESMVGILAGPPGRHAHPRAAREALRHSDSCARCSERLAAERKLSAELDQLARSTASLAASPRLESALRAAFRQRWQSGGSGMRSVMSYSPLPRRRGWTAAMAAAVLAAFAAGLTWRAPLPAPPAARPPLPLSEEVLTPPSAQTTLHKAQEVSGLQRPAHSKTVAAASEPRAQDSVGNPYYPPSDFVPLLYGGDPMLTQTAVVRVELSGAVLQSLGFPLLGEPSERSVQADLMLGEDGVARAIRFVSASASGFAQPGF